MSIDSIDPTAGDEVDNLSVSASLSLVEDSFMSTECDESTVVSSAEHNTFVEESKSTVEVLDSDNNVIVPRSSATSAVPLAIEGTDCTVDILLQPSDFGTVSIEDMRSEDSHSNVATEILALDMDSFSSNNFNRSDNASLIEHRPEAADNVSQLIYSS